ncbi:hypothetical protein [Thalassospira australica]|uniref:hypothetical protein n=1 Tax=Thalassospira australica TaxID=1528106 RepID=UPI00051A54E6|nr:hypothetical protein [Thalassospira australica]
MAKVRSVQIVRPFTSGLAYACVLAIGVFLGFALSVQAAPNPLKASGGGKEVLFAVAEWPPLVTEDVDNFGRWSERVTEIFARMGYEARFDFLSWPRAMELTRRGEYIATFPWLKTEERAEEFHIPRYAMARALHKGFYKKSRFPDGLDINGFDDVAKLGLHAVGIASYWHKEEFNKHNINGAIVANSGSAWRFLDAGRADILFEEEEVGWFDLTNVLGAEAAETYATTDAVPSSSMFILFSRNHPDGEILKAAFDDLMGSDPGREMCQEWLTCDRDQLAPEKIEGDVLDMISEGVN